MNTVSQNKNLNRKSKKLIINFFKKSIVCVIITVFPLWSEKKFSGEALLQDFKTIHYLFSTAHATAFQKISANDKPRIDALFDKESNYTLAEFIRIILKFYGNLQVDHTGLGLADDTMRTLTAEHLPFPLPLKFFENRAYVDCKCAGIPFAAEIETINGKTMQYWIESIHKFARVINDKQQWISWKLEDGFSFLLYTITGAVKTYTIQFKDPEGNSKKVILEHQHQIALGKDCLRISTQRPAYQSAVFFMVNKSLKTTFVSVNTFIFDEYKIRQWVADLHAASQKNDSRYLIIDLRQNTGGLMYMSELLSTAFIEQEINDKPVSRSRLRLIPLREQLSTVNGRMMKIADIISLENHLMQAFSETMKNSYFATRNPNARYRRIMPASSAYRYEKIFVLCGPYTYSASVNFIRLLQLGHSQVVVVGESSGSRGDGHSAEFIFNYRIKNTGINLEIPIVHVQFAPLPVSYKAGEKIQPDVLQSQTLEDFRNHEDTVFNTAVKLIQEDSEMAEP